jgi:hypothetical protein
MDSLILLALVAVVGIPALSLIAFVRTGRLRNLLDEQASKHQRDVSALKQEIAALHGALSRLSRQVDERASRDSAVPSAEKPAHVPSVVREGAPAPITVPLSSRPVRPANVAPHEPQPEIARQPVSPPPKPTVPFIEPAVLSATSETKCRGMNL